MIPPGGEVALVHRKARGAVELAQHVVLVAGHRHQRSRHQRNHEVNDLASWLGSRCTAVARSSATTGEHLAHILVTLQRGAMDRVRSGSTGITWAHGRRVIGCELTEGSGLAAE
jgi:hypothetical protein